MTIKVSIDVPRKLVSADPDIEDVLREQIQEPIPETVSYTDEDGTEYEFDVEVLS